MVNKVIVEQGSQIALVIHHLQKLRNFLSMLLGWFSHQAYPPSADLSQALNSVMTSSASLCGVLKELAFSSSLTSISTPLMRILLSSLSSLSLSSRILIRLCELLLWTSISSSLSCSQTYNYRKCSINSPAGFINVFIYLFVFQAFLPEGSLERGV